MGLAPKLSILLFRYCSGMLERFLNRHRKKIAPTKAQKPTTPTTTPAAIAAVFDPEFFSFFCSAPCVVISLSDVLNTVCPPEVVTTVPPLVVVEVPLSVLEEELEEEEDEDE